MQTRFTPEQLRDPLIAEANGILRKCVHCGFCTATCPTYLLLGNELDSPRGRIYLIKDMLEGEVPPGPETARHLDSCLTCLSCMTTCPSGVDYNHLLEGARNLLEKAPQSRPLWKRFWRALLAAVIPYPERFALAMKAARPFRPLAALLKRFRPMRPAAAMLAMTASGARAEKPVFGVFSPEGPPKARVVMLQGCAQSVLAGRINRATIALLNRCGVEVIIPEKSGCCGALTQHMGREDGAKAFARANIAAWLEADVEAVIINASGCASTVKDYGHLLKDDARWAARAAKVAAMAKDISEYLETLELPPMDAPEPLAVAWHAPCTLNHGQHLADVPAKLLRKAGFAVSEPEEAHICCGAAGVYSILEPEISARLRARKAERLEQTGAQVIASANFGCMHHIASGARLPVVHAVELLEWAAGGERPEEISGLQKRKFT